MLIRKISSSSTLIVLIFLHLSCSSESVSNRCCKTTIQAEPSSYNRTDVFIYAPEAISLDLHTFKITGSGFTVFRTTIKNGIKVVADSYDPNFEWDGRISDKKMASHNSRFEYRVNLITIHGEKLVITGKLCVFNVSELNRKKAERDFEKNRYSYYRCITPGNIHPERGVIYSSGECDPYR